MCDIGETQDEVDASRLIVASSCAAEVRSLVQNFPDAKSLVVRFAGDAFQNSRLFEFVEKRYAIAYDDVFGGRLNLDQR